MHDFTTYTLIFKALSDPTRLQIISMLSDKEVCAHEILESFEITQPTLSYHMKYLNSAGLINSRKNGTWMFYTLNKEKIIQIQGFLEMVKNTA